MLKIVLSLVLTSFVLQCSPWLYEQATAPERRPPSLGVRVIEVVPDSQAARAGIQVMDVLSKYGSFIVIDHSTFYKARAEYLKSPDVKVQVEFWRGPKLLTVQFVPGSMGIVTNEYNAVAYELDAQLKHLDLLEGIPSYQRPVEFKDAFEKEGGIPESLRKAKAILDRAEAEGTLTATQILVARIRLIRDDAPAEELKQQEVLLADFIRNQPAEYIGKLGDRLKNQGQYRPAKVLLKQYLLSEPNNVGVRLNVSYVNLRLGLYDEVDATTDQVLADPARLSRYGFYVAYQQKAVTAMHRGDYKLGIVFAEKAFAQGGDFFELSIIQFGAAVTGDVELFNQTSARIKQQFPDKYESQKLLIDSLEALTLATNGQEQRARAIVAGWSHKDRVEAMLRSYWSDFPKGDKVLENWLQLAKN